MDDGEGNDSMDQFHRNEEAISAVADEGFLGDEDEDYEDLYNDVNVGEGFLQSMRGKNEEVGFRSGVPAEEKTADSVPVSDPGVSIPGVGGGSALTTGGGDSGPRIPGREAEGYNQNPGFRPNEVGTKGGGVSSGPAVSGGNGMRVELGPPLSKVNEFEEQGGNGAVGHQTPPMLPQPPPHSAGNVGNMGGEGMAGNMNGVGGNGVSGAGGAGTILFVGDLHWWTTDAELEGELCKYGQVREVKFFDEKASGKSKGYCQVEFFDPNAATACKEGMNGHSFNGRPCVVAYASPYSVKRMGEAQVNRTQQNASQSTAAQPRRPNEPVGKPGGGNINTCGNYQGGDNYRGGGFGRGNWGRGNAQGMGNRGPMGHMRGRGGAMGGRGIMGNGGNGFGQGIGATPPLMHPQSMMGQGFDSAFGGPMGRMGNYGGFPGGPTPPFSGILSTYPPVNGVGLPGVAPHVNPAFFGRAMPMNGMGMMPNAVDGPNMGMWADPSMGAWAGEDHGSGRAAESSYGEEAASDHQYGEVSHERGGWPNAVKEKDRGSGSSDRRYERDPHREKETAPEDWTERTRHRDDNRERERNRDRDRDRERERSRDRERERERERERDRDRDRERDSRHSRDDRERYADHHRHRDDRTEHDDEWERGRSSRTHSKARVSQEGDHRPRSKDADSGKRRRLTSE